MFYSEEELDVINIFKGSEVFATIKYNYEDERLLILTVINSDDSVTPESESFLSKQKDLGDICLGIITFCQCMDQYVFNKKVDTNLNLDPWPLSS